MMTSKIFASNYFKKCDLGSEKDKGKNVKRARIHAHLWNKSFLFIV